MVKIKILLNGDELEINENSTVQDILNTMNYADQMFVVEKNLKIVPKEEYQTCLVDHDDKIEIVSFFGGG